MQAAYNDRLAATELSGWPGVLALASYGAVHCVALKEGIRAFSPVMVSKNCGGHAVRSIIRAGLTTQQQSLSGHRDCVDEQEISSTDSDNHLGCMVSTTGRMALAGVGVATTGDEGRLRIILIPVWNRDGSGGASARADIHHRIRAIAL